jgi:DNA-binding response OmpR family regulator
MQGKITVLLVDDSLNVCEALKLNLENRHGFIVHTAQTGKAALALARRLRPDIIVLDVMMPGMSGGQVAEVLREYPDTARIPIIFFTGMISKEELENRGGEIGGELFMAKPVNHEELAAVIRAQLGR